MGGEEITLTGTNFNTGARRFLNTVANPDIVTIDGEDCVVQE